MELRAHTTLFYTKRARTRAEHGTAGNGRALPGLALLCVFAFADCAQRLSDPQPSGLALLRAETVSAAQMLRPRLPPGAGPALFRWREHPTVYLLEFEDRGHQSRAMNRLAAFAEKKGSRGKILDDAALGAFIRATGAEPDDFYWAHDYRAADLARFFEAARRHEREGLRTLNSDEMDLERLLRANQLLPTQKEDPTKVLLTVPRSFPPQVRTLLLVHELRHALYFTQPDYRRRCDRVWEQALDPLDRQAITLSLSLLEYDPVDAFLIRNEFQAFLLEAGRPFSGRVQRLAAKDPSGVLWKYVRERPGRLDQIGGLLRAGLGDVHFEPPGAAQTIDETARARQTAK